MKDFKGYKRYCKINNLKEGVYKNFKNYMSTF